MTDWIGFWFDLYGGTITSECMFASHWCEGVAVPTETDNLLANVSLVVAW